MEQQADNHSPAWRRPLEGRFVRAILQAKQAKARAAYRKNIKRLFAKVTHWTVDDERGQQPPTIDAQAVEQQRQRMASPDHGEEQGLRSSRPDYPSPTLPRLARRR
jgi:hypothetical protein